MKVWSGTAFVEKPTKVWDGTTWVTKPVKVWDGTTWVVKPATGGGTTTLPVFRSESHTQYASRGPTTLVTKPAGTVDGDILLACIVAASPTAPSTIQITPPAGFTQLGTETTCTDAGSFTAKFYVYWKRASGEPTGWDFTHSGSLSTISTEAIVMAYSGCAASGSPIDAFSSSSNNLSNPAVYTGITTTQANDKLVLLAHNWDATGTLSPPTGMTERYDHIIYTSDEDRPTAGATGNRTQTLTSVNPWAGVMVGLKGLSSGGGTGPGVGPTFKTIASFTPGPDRNDWTGEVGKRLGIGPTDIVATWMGIWCITPSGTRDIEIREWYADALMRTVTFDLNGKPARSWVWMQISPITLLANGYYALIHRATEADGMQWADGIAPAETLSVSPVINNTYAVYREIDKPMVAYAPNQEYVGIDLGW